MRNHHTHGGYLLVEDGRRFDGERLFGPSGVLGEVVFNTSHSGYQEILSDPSYRRQILTFTTPHIGNVGVNDDDMESDRIQAAGALVRSLSPAPSNWRSCQPLAEWMAERDIPLLAGVNTRALTLHIRNAGAMRAGIFHMDVQEKDALEQVLASPDMSGADLAFEVTCTEANEFNEPLPENWYRKTEAGKGLRVAVLDFGVKRNILRELQRRGCSVTCFPGNTPAGEILDQRYHGVLASNGPGDPAAVTYAIDTLKNLIGKIPLFGICLGHQLISLAAGCETFKLPFGHRGANHPVRVEADGTVEITSQNHGFAVRPDPLPSGWRVSHINLNDRTVEGLEHEEYPVFTIQYHPEASPGPHEGQVYFNRFIREMKHAQA